VKVPVSWLRDLVEIPDDVSIDALAHALHLAGFELAGIESRPADASGRPDAVLDFEITANRPDCVNMVGIAREVSAIYNTPLRYRPATFPATPSASEAGPLRVVIEDATLCPRFTAAVADVTVGPSPAWLVDRLAAADIRSISNIVDITNYVMLEMGQPLHAYDLERLQGSELRARRALAGEKMRTLDGQERTMSDDMLVIADVARPQGIGGVMGGADSEVSAKTTKVALEAAYFQPQSIRRTSKRLGLSTDASYRFERGADPDAPPHALARACELITELGAGRVLPEWIDALATPRSPVVVTLRRARIEQVLGFDVPALDIERILQRLGFVLSESLGMVLNKSDAHTQGRTEVWDVTVPTWRNDVTREIDLIEEVARLEGYERIPTTFPVLSEMPPKPDLRLRRDRTVRAFLLGAGLNEAVTFTFIDRPSALRFADEPQIVAILNPLSEKFAVLRPSLLPGLLDSVAHNRNREQRDVRLFELANRMRRGEGEQRALAIVWTGAASLPHWSGSGREVDVFDIGGVVSSLCDALGLVATLEPTSAYAWLAPRCAATVRVQRSGQSTAATNGSADSGAHAPRDIGVAGQIAPRIAEAHGLPARDAVYVAELNLDAVLDWITLGDAITVRPLPVYPSVVRDLSILVNADLPAARVRDTIRAAAPATLERIGEFDRYQGKGIPEHSYSLSLRLTFRAPDRTLTDAEVQQATEKIIATLASVHGAVLR
jgi:phenylalanyl-tRNA synthetase beta chain